jgi:hypothetical protein
VALLVGLQFVPVDRSNPPVGVEIDAPESIENLLRRACFDCHSNETLWPWYSKVAPVSWWVVSHVDHGRGDLNFSEWPLFDRDAQELAFLEIEEKIREGEMPLASYTILHREARLGEDERKALIDWARSQR